MDLSGFDEEVVKTPSVDLSDFDQPSGPSNMDSFGRGAAQGATLGLGDELSAGLESGAGAIESLAMGNNAFGDQGRLSGLSNLVDNYTRARDTQRGQNTAADEANPLSYLGGNLTGSLAPSVLMGGGSIGVQTAKNAAMGAVQGYGNSDARNVIDQAKDAAGTGAASAGLTALFGAAGSGIGTGANKLRNYFAIKALGPTAKENMAISGRQNVDRMVQRLMDEKIISPLDNLESIKEKLGVAMKGAGQDLGDFSNAVEGVLSGEAGAKEKLAAQVVKSPNGPVGTTASRLPEFSGSQNWADESKGAIQEYLDQNVFGKAGAGYRGASESASNFIENELPNAARERVPFQEVRSLRGVLQEKARDASGLVRDTPIAEMYSKAGQGMNQVERGLVQRAGEFSDNPEALGAYNQLKARSEDLLTANGPVDRGLGRENNRMPLGGFATHVGAGGIGAYEGYQKGGITGSILGGLGAAAAGSLVRSRGSSTAATAFNAVQKLATQSPASLGKFANVIKNSIARGPQDFAVTHYVLQQTDPSYREMSNSLNTQENQ